MFSNIGPVQLLIVLAIVVMIFGTKKLRNMGSDLGSAIKGFKKAVSNDEEAQKVEDKPAQVDTKASAEKTVQSEPQKQKDNT